MCNLRLVRHDDWRAIRNADLDFDLIGLALVCGAVRRRDDHAAVHDAIEVPFELVKFFDDFVFDGVAFLDALEGDLERCLHSCSLNFWMLPTASNYAPG